MNRTALSAPARVVWILVMGIAAGLCILQAVRLFPLDGSSELDRVILFHSVLPRAAVALLSGAALGLSGALLQQVLRNPIADPSTLGISAGAQLAITVATLAAPALIETARSTVALAGGAGVMAVLLAISWKRSLEPVVLVLGGMVISLIAISFSATLILANGEYMMSLLIWGSGSLTQQGWDSARAIAMTLAVSLAASILLVRPLTIVGLDDASARSLGVNLLALRLAILSIAIWLATSVSAEVGIIGFVGLAAPTFARLCGARSQKEVLMTAPLAGAAILWLTDGMVQFLAGDPAKMIPTGAATALLGGPVLLYLLPRLRSARHGMPDAPPVRRISHPVLILAACIVLAAGLTIVAILIGRGPEGWNVATGPLAADLMPFRAPRTLAAFAAGAMLAAAGTILQRLTRNPLASPEVLGISAGAGVGLAAVLFTQFAPSMNARLVGAGAGVLLVLVILLSIAGRKAGEPERLLLGGLAAGAVCSALVSLLMATGDMRAFQLLGWLSGSTNEIGWKEALMALSAAAMLLGPLPLLMRWLDILPLGPASARALGLPLHRARIVLILVSAGLTAAASLIAGPLSFVGLVAPHTARLIGFGPARHQIAAAILIGASLMTAADWLCRMVAFPYQLPLGLFASLIGGPYLIWLLRKGN